MCGIFGVLGELSLSINANQSQTVLETLIHRGPDNQELLTSVSCSLAHTKLSIIGPGENSNQPYTRTDSDWIMTFNGEIYNYKEIRKVLIGKGYNFESNSDTEVLFRGFCEFGISFFSKIRGMFAVAFYNPKEEQLVLARDYSGEKPLYYMFEQNSVIFSSCISTIASFISKNLSVDESNVEKYFHYQFVPSHLSIFKQVENVKPGTILEISFPNFHIIENEITLPTCINVTDKIVAIEKIKETFRVSVERTLVSDVPIAISLSGGMDSVSVAAQIREIDPGIKITSFTAGYEGNYDFDERKIAHRVAKEFGFEHVEIENKETGVY